MLLLCFEKFYLLHSHKDFLLGVLGFTLKTVVQFEIIFVDGIKKEVRVDVHSFSIQVGICWKVFSFLIELPWHLCKTSIHIRVCLFLESLFSSIVLCLCF